jgi:hypothetical protein
VSDCVSDSGGDTDYGPWHSFWTNGDTFDCIAIGLINPFIAYQSTSYPGTRYVRCHAVGRGSYTSSTAGISYGFYMHSNPGQSVKRAIFEDCWATNISAGWGGTDVENWILKNCQGRKIDYAFRGGTKSGSSATTVQLLGGTFVLSTTTAQNGIQVFGSSFVSTANRTILRGARIVAKGVVEWLIQCDAGTLDVKNSSLIFFDAAVATGSRRLVSVAQAGVALVFGNNIVLNADTSSSDSFRAYSAGATITSANNVFQGDCNFNLAGTSYANLAAFQAAGKDAGSVTTAQTFVGQLRNGDTRLGDAASAWTLQAGADLDGDNQEVWLPLFVAATQT